MYNISLCMRTWREDRNFAIQKFCLTWHRCENQYWVPVSSEISDLRNFWLHTIYACTE